MTALTLITATPPIDRAETAIFQVALPLALTGLAALAASGLLVAEAESAFRWLDALPSRARARARAILHRVIRAIYREIQIAIADPTVPAPAPAPVPASVPARPRLATRAPVADPYTFLSRDTGTIPARYRAHTGASATVRARVRVPAAGT